MKHYLIPQSLSLDAYTYPECTAFILNKIYQKWMVKAQKNDHDLDRNCSVQIHRRFELESRFGSKKVGLSLQELRNANASNGVVIRRVTSYQVGSNSFGYQLCTPYCDTLPRKVSFRCSDIRQYDIELIHRRKQEIKNLENESYRKTCENLNLISLEFSNEEFENLRAFIKEACYLEFINNADYWKKQIRRYYTKRAMGESPIKRTWEDRYRDKITSILYKLAEIKEGRDARYVPFYTVDEYGRCHHFLTSLPRELRPYVRLGAKPIKAYDIRSSQVLFFAMTVREKVGRGVNFNDILDDIQAVYPERAKELKGVNIHKAQKELRRFISLLQGDVYVSLMEAIGWQESRSLFKEHFFGFLYGMDKRNSKLLRLFIHEFPAIYMLLFDMKNIRNMVIREQELDDEIREKILTENPNIPKEKLLTILKSKIMDVIASEKTVFYGNLPCQMQKVESDFIFNSIIPQIPHQPFIPVHDAICVKETCRQNIAKLIIREFRKIRIPAYIKTELWSENLCFKS